MVKLCAFYLENQIEAGCDEAGRGCLAGPVVAASVILNDDLPIEALNDSKKLSEKVRYTLKSEIIEKAKAYGVGIVCEKEIDSINILNASIRAMHLAVNELNTKPEFLLIDGNRFHRYENIPHLCIIKGDGKYQSIAAASILAKTVRDEIMNQLHLEYPVYNWKKNKGYPTKDHREAIEKYGPSPYHRQTFKLLADKPNATLFDEFPEVFK
ncbi:MAG: ribonuclease HII [Flavobacteriales bacterium]|nr:ribonuclease HII [Flavobacteriales bacterium]NCA21303.1 ribonuclease HII [Crocinitomicaceae bacterium]